MAWRQNLFSQESGARSKEPEFHVAFCLYTPDGKRGAEVRVRRDGQIYFVEQEWVEGTTFRSREHGEEVGPYKNTEEAEAAAAIRPWFLHGENSN